MLAPTKNTTKNPTTTKIREFLDSQSLSHADLEAARQLIRARAKEDLWFLAYHMLDMKDIATVLHMDMTAKWFRRRLKKFSLWLIPRSHLKTSLWTVAGSIQELLIDPDQRILIVNAKLTNAVDILAEIRTHWESNELLRWAFPEYCVDKASKRLRNRCKWGTERLDFPCSKYAGRKEGNIEIMGVEASLVSKHYDLMIFDDPVNDLNTSNKPYRDKIESWYKNALQLRHSPESRIRLIGTRWHFDDLYSRIIRKEKQRRKQLAADGKRVRPRYWIYHRQVVEKVEVGGEEIAGYSGVQPIWSERFSKAEIETLRDENGSYIFSCQYMNNPLPEEDAIFKHSDIQPIDYYDIPEDLVYFAAIDMAVEDTLQGDVCAISVAGFDNLGRMFTRKVIRGNILTREMLRQVNDLVQEYGIRKVGVETVCFQKTLYKEYKRLCVEHGYKIPWVEIKRGKGSKLRRWLALQPRVERGDFYYEEGMKNAEWMIDEMTTVPRPTFDDILDTLCDIETLYYKAPKEVEEVLEVGTWNALHGSLEDEPRRGRMSSAVISTLGRR